MAQKIIRGIQNAQQLLSQGNYLLVCGPSYRYFPFQQMLKPRAVFKDFTPNPLYEQVVAGIELFRKSGAEAIVAVGGGSAMDVAKCIKLFSGMDPDRLYLDQEKKDTGIPLTAIPTTAGTGSESTCHAVIYYQGQKQSISHPSIVPDVAVLEPEVLISLPVYQKKCTMLDALCQAIESWWSVHSDQESRCYSKKAITLIRENWKPYIENNSAQAAERILEAANYAGRAINLTATTAAHAMSYQITSLYGLPHGHAVAVCMEKIWAYMLKAPENCIDPRGRDYYENTMKEIAEYADLHWFLQLMSDLGMEGPRGRDREKELDLLTKSVNPVRLKNHPVELTDETIRILYEEIVK